MVHRAHQFASVARLFVAGVAAKMMFPLVREVAADRIPAGITCWVLGFSQQAFFAWRRSPAS